MKFKIYCINLYEREDRYLFMKKQFEKYNLNVKFIRNHKNKLGGRYGCFKSHIQCLKHAQKNNIDICLIFEDDIKLDENCNKNIKKCLNFIKKNIYDVDILYGNSRILFLDKLFKNNFYHGKATGAFTIFLTKNVISYILNNYKKYIKTNLHYDLFLFLKIKKTFINYEYTISHLMPFGSNNNNWGNNIFSIFSQYLSKYTFIHFKINNILIINIFKFLIENKCIINDIIKIKLINFINKLLINKAYKNIDYKIFYK